MSHFEIVLSRKIMGVLLGVFFDGRISKIPKLKGCSYLSVSRLRTKHKKGGSAWNPLFLCLMQREPLRGPRQEIRYITASFVSA